MTQSTCTNCGQQLRYPSVRGRLTVKCPKCGHEFDYEPSTPAEPSRPDSASGAASLDERPPDGGAYGCAALFFAVTGVVGLVAFAPVGICLLAVAAVCYGQQGQMNRATDAWYAARRAESDAESKRRQEALREEREAAKARLRSLIEGGELVRWQDLEGEHIQCGNGHRYRLGDFRATETETRTRVEKVRTSGTYSSGSVQFGKVGDDSSDSARYVGVGFTDTDVEVEQAVPVTESFTTWSVGYPVCRSSQFRFARPELNSLRLCDRYWGNLDWETDSELGLSQVPHFFQARNGRCPIHPDTSGRSVGEV